MIEILLQIAAILVVLTGTAFSVLGVLGFIRLPDVYTRLHATGKVSVFGVALLAVAALLLPPADAGKALILIVLLIVGGPVASHAMASAAYRIGIPLKQAQRDDLAQAAQRHPDKAKSAQTGEA